MKLFARCFIGGKSELGDILSGNNDLELEDKLERLFTKSGIGGWGDYALVPVGEEKKVFNKVAAEIYSHATSGAKITENLEFAEGMRDEIFGKIMSGTKTPDEVTDLQKELTLVLKSLESGGKQGLSRDDSGKLKLSGSGSRSNPLPPIAETDYIQCGANGKTVICVKTSALVGASNQKNDPFNPDVWQAFVATDGVYSNWGALCTAIDTSWSSVNQQVNNRVRENSGGNVGTGGMIPITRQNVETALEQCGHSLKAE